MCSSAAKPQPTNPTLTFAIACSFCGELYTPSGRCPGILGPHSPTFPEGQGYRIGSEQAAFCSLPSWGEGWGGGCLFDSAAAILPPSLRDGDLPHKGGGNGSELQAVCRRINRI